jgi:hypothetical protein
MPAGFQLSSRLTTPDEEMWQQKGSRRHLKEKVLTYANHLRVYSEEIGLTARRSAISPRRSRTWR